MSIYRIGLASLILCLGAACGGESEGTPPPEQGEDPPPSQGSEDPPPAEGQMCGTRGAGPCPEGTYCEHPESAACGETDHPGTCQPRPEMCTRDYRPVCGCDGRTYGNACSAAAEGVSMRRRGECDAAAADCQRGGCGGELCVADASGVASICVARPEHACYASATCERQPDGACGWTQTPTLIACLASPPPMQ